jgi:MobA/MobL family
MANYFLHVKTFSRGNGSRVTKAAAYRAGERIRDERSSAVYNYSARTDVAHAEIVLPSEYAGRVDMEWALDRSTLWNAAEHAGRLRNSRLGRELLVHVPPEMTPAQRTQLVRSFSQELADRYRNAVDFAVHEPRANADHRHHHAHILMTTREVHPGGLGGRAMRSARGIASASRRASRAVRSWHASSSDKGPRIGSGRSKRPCAGRPTGKLRRAHSPGRSEIRKDGSITKPTQKRSTASSGSGAGPM